MKCKNCGKKINDNNTKFCPNCGVEISALNNELPELTINGTKKKNSKKIIIGLAVVLFLIVVCGVIISVFLPKIQMAIMGESTYYFYQESKNISSLLTSETIADLRHPESYSAKSVAKANFSGDEYVSEILSSMQATATVNYNKSSATVNSDLSLQDEGNTLFTLSGNYIDSKFVIGSDLMNSQLVFDNPLLNILKLNNNKFSSNGSQIPNNNDNTITEKELLALEYFSEADMKELLEVSRTILNENVDSKAVSTKENINGENADMITFTFSGSDLDALSVAFINEIMNNTDLVPVAEKIVELYSANEQSSSGMSELEYLKKFIQENSPISQDINQLTLSYACDSRGDILYRGYVVDYGSFESEGKINTTFDGDDIATLNAEIIPDSDIQESVSFSLSKTIEGGSSNIDIKYSDIYYTFNANIENMHSEKCGGVPVLLGTCNMNLLSAGDEIFDITANATNLGDKYDISVQGSMYGEASFGGTISTSLSTNPNATNEVAPEYYDTNIPDYITELFNNIGSAVTDYVDDKYEDNYDYYY